MITCISAVQHLRRLRGGSQSHLLRASDGASYVTKFQNNPQHIRVLANEMLATRLGLRLCLPMPRVEEIEVCDWLIAHTPDLRIQLAGTEIPCQSGKQLASLLLDRTLPALPSTTCLASCWRVFATLGTLPAFLSWTSGRAMPMGGKRSFRARRREAADTKQRLLIRATASMPASGCFLISRCEACTRTTASTRMLRDGNRLSRRSAGQKRWMRVPFGSVPPIFPKSGTKATGPVLSG